MSIATLPAPTIATDIDPIFAALHERVTIDHPHYQQIRELEEACVDAEGWAECICNPNAKMSPEVSAAIWNLQKFAMNNGIITEAEMAELYPEPAPAE